MGGMSQTSEGPSEGFLRTHDTQTILAQRPECDDQNAHRDATSDTRTNFIIKRQPPRSFIIT